MRRIYRRLGVALTSMLISVCAAGAQFENLPVGWRVVNTFEASGDQRAAIGRKLGGDIEGLSNAIISAQGKKIQVNVIEAASRTDAKKLHGAVAATKGDPAFCLLLGSRVVEFVGSDANLATKAAFELGFKPKPQKVRYRISFEAAPVEDGDYMAWNELYVSFLRYDGEDGSDAKKRIAELSQKFTFAGVLNVRSNGTAGIDTIWKFQPAPQRSQSKAEGEIVSYTFAGLPQKAGVSYVHVSVEAGACAPAKSRTMRKSGPELLRATASWPSDDPAIVALARRITAGKTSRLQKVNAILAWLQPGRNIRFGGPVTGSRYGVKKVLKQKYGHCWDFADCFVTLCRAVDIPCRQVAGWLYGSEGHIWAEVLYDDQGLWQQVDPTGGTVAPCGIYHVAYLTSEDGGFPLVYLSRPDIEMVADRTGSAPLDIPRASQ